MQIEGNDLNESTDEDIDELIRRDLENRSALVQMKNGERTSSRIITSQLWSLSDRITYSTHSTL